MDKLFGRKLRSARVRFGHKRARVVRRHGHLVAILNLRNLSGRTVTLRARAHTVNGKRVKRRKRYVVCVV